MINVTVSRNSLGQVYQFIIENHSSKLICAAVSILSQNTVNSIEAFTDEKIEYEYDISGGFLDFCLPDLKNGGENHDVTLLLDTLLLGLGSLREAYPGSIQIIEQEVPKC